MPHPDLLLDSLSWEQWRGWKKFYEQDPWGELRQDLRGIAHAMLANHAEDTSPVWPYWDTPEDQHERMEAIEDRAKAMDMDALKARLKHARELHLKAKEDGR